MTSPAVADMLLVTVTLLNRLGSDIGWQQRITVSFFGQFCAIEQVNTRLCALKASWLEGTLYLT